ncbi:uncharacterized protein LOC115874928 isoform X2 [Sitophilus oryzae]|uniref:Uncharacterized protein LOC115874928 isoform X2 n=1 Tax=Sitophilus oryzae TaxID=7048 RepID=A0A6J2X4J6_SITOR|nr:uncharacterized protein LOC115874928 isoform X2 [Sitophilus oryzae]
MFFSAVLYYIITLQLVFVLTDVNKDFPQKHIHKNLKMLKKDFNKILEDVEDFATDFFFQVRDIEKYTQGLANKDYDWNDDTTSSTKPVFEHTLTPPETTLDDSKLSLPRKKRSVPTISEPEQKFQSMKNAFKSATPNTKLAGLKQPENGYEEFIQKKKSIEQVQKFDDSILGQTIDKTTESTFKTDKSVEDTVCPTNKLEKQKLDELKTEMKKLNELVSLLKDQQDFFRGMNILNEKSDNDGNSKILIKKVINELAQKENDQMKDDKSSELGKIQLSLNNVYQKLNKTRLMLDHEHEQQNVIENELKKQINEVIGIQKMVNHLYNRNVQDWELKQSSNQEKVEDSLLGSVQKPLPPFFNSHTDLLHDQNYHKIDIFGNLDNKQKVNKNVLGDENDSTEYKKSKESIPASDIKNRQVKDLENILSEEKVSSKASAIDNIDDLRTKLKLIEMLNKEDKNTELDNTNDKVNEAIKKILFPEKKPPEKLDVDLLLALAQLKRKENEKPQNSVEKLLKILNTKPESRTDTNIETELKLLQEAINKLRPKEDADLDGFININDKGGKDDASNFQNLLSEIISNGIKEENNKKLPTPGPEPSLSANVIANLTPQQLLQLKESINGKENWNNFMKAMGTKQLMPQSIDPMYDYNNLKYQNYPPSAISPQFGPAIIPYSVKPNFYGYQTSLDPSSNYGLVQNYYNGRLNPNLFNAISGNNYKYQWPLYEGNKNVDGNMAGLYKDPSFKSYVPYSNYESFPNNPKPFYYSNPLSSFSGYPSNIAEDADKQWNSAYQNNNRYIYNRYNTSTMNQIPPAGTNTNTNYGNQFFPISEQAYNYGQPFEGYADDPKGFSKPNMVQSQFNDQNTDQYKTGVITDLTSQIENLENVIQNLNQPYTQEVKDKNTIWNLEQRIYDLKSVVNSLNPPYTQESRQYTQMNQPNKVQYVENPISNIPRNLAYPDNKFSDPSVPKIHNFKPYDHQYNSYPENIPNPPPVQQYPPIQEQVNDNSPKSVISPFKPENQPALYQTNYTSSYQVNPQENNLPPQVREVKNDGNINRRLNKNSRKKRQADYRSPEVMAYQYNPPQQTSNFVIGEGGNQMKYDLDDNAIKKIVNLFNKYLGNNITTQQEIDTHEDSDYNEKGRSNLLNGLQEKLDQLKMQLELQKHDDNPFSYKVESKSTSLHQDIFTKIVVKILDKLIAVTPTVLSKLFGNLVTDIGATSDYYSPLQNIFKNLGVAGYFPLILIKILETTGTVIQYMKKNSFVRNFLVPGISLALVAGAVLFVIYFYQDNQYNTELSDNNYDSSMYDIPYKSHKNYRNTLEPREMQYLPPMPYISDRFIQNDIGAPNINNLIPYSRSYYDYFNRKRVDNVNSI